MVTAGDRRLLIVRETCTDGASTQVSNTAYGTKRESVTVHEKLLTGMAAKMSQAPLDRMQRRKGR